VKAPNEQGVASQVRAMPQVTTVAAANGQIKTGTKKSTASYFYFDPEDPENVVEVRAANSIATKADVARTASFLPVMPAPAVKIVPSSPSSNGNHGSLNGTQLAMQQITNQTGIMGKTEKEVGQALAKAAVMQQELIAALEQERGRVMELAQYESLYREWRVRADQLVMEVTLLQRSVTEKDEELGHAYKKLESNAVERSALRKHVAALIEENTLLRGALTGGEISKLLSQGPKTS